MGPKVVASSIKKSEEILNKLFDTFADEEDPEVIGSEGIETICTQIGITDAASDVRALVLCWKLGASTLEPLKPGCIKRGEFISSMINLKQEKIEDLAKMLPSFDPGFMDQKEFRNFYRFVHKFSREDGTQKRFLEKNFVIDLLPIVLDISRAPHLKLFLIFLATRPDSDTISADQWDSFLMFNQVVSLNLDGYDEDSGAWPLLLDEYVEWRKHNKL